MIRQIIVTIWYEREVDIDGTKCMFELGTGLIKILVYGKEEKSAGWNVAKTWV